MLIPLRAIPLYERHLLHCTDPVIRSGREEDEPSDSQLHVLNRMLARLDEAVDAATLFNRPDALPS